MKKAMLTIEVLVALLILFLVITSSTMSLKSFGIINNKKSQYEKEYMSVLNIKDILQDDICVKSMTKTGKFDGYTYKAQCAKEKELRNYQKAFEIGDPEGNIGSYMIRLYKVNLHVSKGRLSKNYIYHLTTGARVL
jgi:hypothetical protein